MAIGPIVTRGFGTFGNVNLVVTRGYSSGEAAVIRTAKKTARRGFTQSGFTRNNVQDRTFKRVNR